MNPSTPDTISLTTALVLGIGALLAVLCWGWLGWRRWRQKPVLPLVLRRRVPWDGLAVLGIVLFYLLLASAGPYTVSRVFGIEPGMVDRSTENIESGMADRPAEDNAHPVVNLVRERPRRATIALCLAAVVVVAPLAEELLFRVVLQGWLEAVASRVRRHADRRLRFLRDSMPILFSAFLFAVIHARSLPRMNPDYLLYAIGMNAVYSLLFVAATIILLRTAERAAWRDLGVPTTWRDLRRGVGQGLVGCAAVFAPVYLVHAAAIHCMPKGMAPDPVGIFPLALALGALYFRTRNAAACVTLHMAFNAVGMATLLLEI